MTTAALSQSHFRGRRDGGAIDSTPEWIANEDTNFTWGVGTNFRIRFTVQETAGGNPAADSVKLQCNLNGGAFQDVTTSSTIVRAVTYGGSAEDSAITTKRLSGTGTYVNGRYSHDGSPATNVDLTASANTEWEFDVVIRAADVANGNTIQLKVVQLTGTSITASVVPTVTVSEVAVVTQEWWPDLAYSRKRNRYVSAAAASIFFVPAIGLVPPPAVDTPVAFAASGEVLRKPRVSKTEFTDLYSSTEALAPSAATSTGASAFAQTAPTILLQSLIYDPVTEGIQPPAPLSLPLANVQSDVTIRKRRLYDPATGIPPPVPSSVPFANVQSDVAIRKRRLYDPVTGIPAPEAAAVAAAPLTGMYGNITVRRSVTHSPVAGTPHIPVAAVATPAAFGYVTNDPFVAQRSRKRLNDSFARSLLEPAAPTPITGTFAASASTIIQTSLIYDPVTGPVFPPEAAPAVPTSSSFAYGPQAPDVRRPRAKRPPLSSFVLARRIDDWAFVADYEFKRLKRTRLLDNVLAAIGEPAPAVLTPAAFGYLGVEPGRLSRSRSKQSEPFAAPFGVPVEVTLAPLAGSFSNITVRKSIVHSPVGQTVRAPDDVVLTPTAFGYWSVEPGRLSKSRGKQSEAFAAPIGVSPGMFLVNYVPQWGERQQPPRSKARKIVPDPVGQIVRTPDEVTLTPAAFGYWGVEPGRLSRSRTKQSEAFAAPIGVSPGMFLVNYVSQWDERRQPPRSKARKRVPEPFGQTVRLPDVAPMPQLDYRLEQKLRTKLRVADYFGWFVPTPPTPTSSEAIPQNDQNPLKWRPKKFEDYLPIAEPYGELQVTPPPVPRLPTLGLGFADTKQRPLVRADNRNNTQDKARPSVRADNRDNMQDKVRDNSSRRRKG